MIKKMYSLIFLIAFWSAFSQERVTPKQVEAAFNLIFQQPDTALQQLHILQERSKHQKDSLNAIVLGHIGVYYAVKSDFDKAAYYFDLAIKKGVKGSKSYVNNKKNRAIIYKKVGDTDTAIRLLKQILVLANKNKYLDTAAIIYGELGSCYSAIEDYENALNYLIKSIELWNKYSPLDLKKIAIEKQKLANLYFKMNNGKYALQVYKEIIPIFRLNGDFYNLYLCQINEANIYIHLENPRKANELLNEALVELRKFDNKELILFAKERKAKCLELLKRYDLAIVNYKNAFDYGLQHDQIRTIYTFIEMGNLFMAQNRMNELFPYIELTILPKFQSLFQKTTTEDQKRFYELLVDFYTAQNVSPEKIRTYKKMRDEKAELLQAKYDLYKVREKQAEYRMNLAEKETTIASQKVAIQRIKIYILYGLGFFLIVIGVVLYSRFKLKQQLLQSNLAKTTLAQQLAEREYVKEKEISTLRLQKIKQQEQELLAQTLEKVEADKKIEKVVAELGADISPKKLKQFQTLLKGNTKYWENVIEKFHHINPTFNQILLDQYPQLTKGERDFCSFIKLNLSNKEIAHLLQISPESVITKKYRIVKKLDLPKEVDFQQWLLEIG